ncbi:MAG: hypothetical protein COA88_14860 [Kordia sp.]|nr:MAG: hypothetical protein COA88_14860 [Kordia sp.]
MNYQKISSRFGMRMHLILKIKKMHKGIDFKAPFGTPVYATSPGVVTFSGKETGYGNIIKLNTLQVMKLGTHN